MRTTIAIDADVLAVAKAIARQRDQTAGRVAGAQFPAPAGPFGRAHRCAAPADTPAQCDRHARHCQFAEQRVAVTFWLAQTRVRKGAK
jgi:hypothetical protein